MTQHLNYALQLGVQDNADVEDLEEFLQQVLLDLYEQGQVESIRVTKDGHTSEVKDDDVAKMIDVIDGVDSEALRKAIDSVYELEDIDDE